jgi:hypothetical protein
MSESASHESDFAREDGPPFFDEDSVTASIPTRAQASTAPQDGRALAAEESVIGALLAGGAWSEVADLVRAEDYSSHKHRLILPAIEQLARNGEPHDPVTVAQKLDSLGHLVVAGGIAYLSQLFRTTPTAANVRAYARAVRERAIRSTLPPDWRDAEAIGRMRRTLAELDKLNAGDTVRTLSGVDFSQMQPHLADGYLIKWLLAPQTLVGIIGASSSGKTFFATDLALHIAAGRGWRDSRVRGGPVVYVALEGPFSAENRFVAARKHAGFVAGIPLRLTPGPINLRDPPDVARLIDFIRETQSLYGQACVAVFVDTLSRAMSGGDENGSEDMGALIRGADAVRLATGASVILVHHLGKDESRGARGHTSLKCALDTEIEVAERGDVHVATVTKQRDLVAGQQFAFSLRSVELGEDADGDPVTTCVVQPLDEAPSQRKGPSGANQRALLAALQEWKRQHPDSDIVSSIDLREIAKSAGITKKTRLQESIDGLEKLGWLSPCVGGFRFNSDDAL